MRGTVLLGRLAVLMSVVVWGAQGRADTVSYTGNLMSPEDTFETTVTLTSAGDITLQTYGFGGGTNAAGTAIAAGGFDPFVGLFSGTGDDAMFVDGTSDILSNYVAGCPPAGTVTIGGVPGQCGDVAMTFSGLTPGTYTLLLTDAANLPNAVFETDGTLGDGFFDLTGGAFQTCVDENDCNTDTADWALDVTTEGEPTTSPVPEPASLELAGIGMMLSAMWMYWSKRQQKKS